MSEDRYIILRLDDAKALADAVRSVVFQDARMPVIIERLRNETGADIQDIASGLKRLPICFACVQEDQQQYCNCIGAQKSGRRLKRLLDRADAALAETPEAK